MRNDLWVIECRTPDGKLDFAAPQPESVFGNKAITGISQSVMSRVIYARDARVTLDGRCIAQWPAILDPRWRARRKTW